MLFNTLFRQRWIAGTNKNRSSVLEISPLCVARNVPRHYAPVAMDPFSSQKGIYETEPLRALFFHPRWQSGRSL